MTDEIILSLSVVRAAVRAYVHSCARNVSDLCVRTRPTGARTCHQSRSRHTYAIAERRHLDP